MPFGYLKRLFRPKVKKATLTRTSTLPEINLASPIYIVIDSAEETPQSRDVDSVSIPGEKSRSMMVKPNESPLVTPPPPIVIDDSDLNDPSSYDNTSLSQGDELAGEYSHKASPEPTPSASSPDSKQAPSFFDHVTNANHVKGGPLKSPTNLVAQRFLSQSTSNVSDTNWQDDHRFNNLNSFDADSRKSSSLLQLPGDEEGMSYGDKISSAQSESDLSNLDNKGEKHSLIARRVAKTGRSGSWRKTWSRSFRKNVLGLDDPDDPEAAKLRKYRTRRKKYGGKHFIIALYNCSKPKEPNQLSKSMSVDASYEPAATQEHEREPDTFCAEIMEEFNFESRNDPTRLLPESVSERHKEKVKKSLANFFYADNISEQIAYNYFVSDVNNEVKEFMNMRFPFVIVFYHEEHITTVNCVEIVKVLKAISHDYNLFKINVLADMVFGSRNSVEKKLSLNMPYLYVFGKNFCRQDNILYHGDCSSCEMLHLILSQRSIEAFQVNERGDLYEKIMTNKLLRNNFFHTALVTYNLVMCGLYTPVEGMMGRKSQDKSRVEDDVDDEYLSD